MHRFRWLAVGIIVAGGVYLYPRPFLSPLGNYLVQAEAPVRSDCLFVLAGDERGQRILKAIELYRQGFAPKVFVSGPQCCYGHTEDEMAISFAKRNGAADVPFIGLPHNARSTLSEGIVVLPELRKAGCLSVLVVTSDFHTRRAGNILRRVWPGVTVHLASAPSLDYDASNWWTDRNYQKTFFFEWTKTVSDWIGL